MACGGGQATAWSRANLLEWVGGRAIASAKLILHPLLVTHEMYLAVPAGSYQVTYGVLEVELGMTCWVEPRHSFAGCDLFVLPCSP